MSVYLCCSSGYCVAIVHAPPAHREEAFHFLLLPLEASPCDYQPEEFLQQGEWLQLPLLCPPDLCVPVGWLKQ